MIMKSILQIVLNVCVPNNRASKYMRGKKNIALKGQIDKSRILVGI